MRKLFKKLALVKIHACAFIFRQSVKQSEPCINYSLKVFTNDNKSGIKKIDVQLNNTNECYAVFNGDLLIHTSWVFKKKLLTSQLGFRNVYTLGDCDTIATYRGQGIYTNVLKIISSRKEKDILIFVAPNNLPSIRGIKKAGFEKLFEFELLRLLGFKIWLRKM